MIERYSTPAMSQIWSLESRFQFMLEVEIAVAQVQSELGLIPKSAYRMIKSKARFDVVQIQQIEKTVKHDVIAFVTNVAQFVGPMGRYLHFGLTSSDVLDTALSLQMKVGGELILAELQTLKKVMACQIQEHQSTLCAGRTHGMWAEPTTFGLKLAGFLAELKRNEQRLKQAIENNQICKLSGAVGTYSSLPPKVEQLVAKKLKLKPETVATQVIPRDRQAEFLVALSFLLTGFERLAVELRHLQRSEVAEVLESFQSGQKGSSAMPHKQNPITAENITGLARMVRSYSQAMMDNIVLWHERDISHSSVERVFLPDAFILSHYAIGRMTQLISGLVVNQERMQTNVDQSYGLLMSSHLLLLLIEKGQSREEAYACVQALSFKAKQQKQHLRDLVRQDPQLAKKISTKELDQLFSGQSHLKYYQQIIKQALK